MLAQLAGCNSFFVNFIAETQFVCTRTTLTGSDDARRAKARQSVAYLQRSSSYCNTFEKQGRLDLVTAHGIAIAPTLNSKAITAEVQQPITIATILALENRHRQSRILRIVRGCSKIKSARFAASVTSGTGHDAAGGTK